jgi:hypothetical protein
MAISTNRFVEGKIEDDWGVDAFWEARTKHGSDSLRYVLKLPSRTVIGTDNVRLDASLRLTSWYGLAPR